MNPEWTYEEIREAVREECGDSYALLWDDSGLNELIDRAQREYALVSGRIIGEITVKANAGGIYDFPGDYLKTGRYYGPDGLELPLVYWKRLAEDYGDFRTITGSYPKCLCDDFDGYGKFRIFPRLAVGADAGTILYKRQPKSGIPEAENRLAILNHVLYQTFLLSRTDGWQKYERRFHEEVNRENASNEYWGGRGRIRKIESF